MKCNFRLNCILKQDLRCYDVRSKSLKKPPFRPHFRPFCPHPAYGSLLRAEGCTHFLAPPTSAWRPCPPGHWSPAPRPTTSGPAGSDRAQTLPRWLLPSTDHRIDKDRAGPDLDGRPPSIQYVTESGDPVGKIKLLWALASWCARTGGRGPFAEGATVPGCSWLRTNWRAPMGFSPRSPPPDR